MFFHSTSEHSESISIISRFSYHIPVFFVSFDLYNLLQKEPELLSGNDVLWTFVNFAGEDHTNFKTLVAFLEMLGTLV